MISVHNTFVCKPGNAGKMAKMMKKMPQTEMGPFVMTDMTGQFHRVIIVGNYKDLADYEVKMKEEMEKDWSKEDPEVQKMWAGMNDMYISGSREIYKIW
jgi:hypothetical protein